MWIPNELVESGLNESLGEQLLDLPDEVVAEYMESLDEEQRLQFKHSWDVWGRPKQQPPDACRSAGCGCQGNWTIWLILSGRAWGKALAVDTPIPTLSGWKAMGDLATGDVLFDETGKQTTVTHAFDVMHGRPCYRVKFSDGSEIVADEDHEWYTETKLERKRHRRGSIRTTKQISESVRYRGKESNHAIPAGGPLDALEARLPIDPYTLGAWLGDGSSASGEFTFSDAEIADRISAGGYRIEKRKRYRWSSFGLFRQLRMGGLLENKHIPAEYQRASARQRLELLRGLMDTDGHVEASGKCEFTSTNERLAREAYELIVGLGIRASLFSGRATLNGKDCGPKYRVYFYRPAVNVFRLRRKADRLLAAGDPRTLVSRYRYIESVEPCESVPVRCIKVDSLSSLFLASRAMIPTHNSRTGSEWVHLQAHRFPGCRIAVIAPTARAARQVMIEGESGILETEKPWNKCKYWPSKLEIDFANGSLCTIFSADEPERLRGAQHHFAWCDELCAWGGVSKQGAVPKDRSNWQMMRLGLRLPAKPGWPDYRPRIVVTTTPKPTDLIRELARKRHVKGIVRTHVTTGSTYENRTNLDSDYFASVITDLEGTRLGRQELQGEILDDTPGALWRSSIIDPYRVTVEDIDGISMKKTVVAIDPSVGGDNETGMIVCSTGPAPIMSDEELKHLEDRRAEVTKSLRKNQKIHGYVLADISLEATQSTPDAWARQAVRAYHEFDANCIVAEANQGGEMVRHTINTVDPTVPVILVHATKAKKTRAEPVVALFEQGRIHMVGTHARLENQLLTWDPSEGLSPDRLDAMVWGLHHLLGKSKISALSAPIQMGVRTNPWEIIPE